MTIGGVLNCAVNATLAVKPPMLVSVAVALPCAAAFEAFWNTGMVIGFTLMLKSHPDGSGATVSRIVTWCPIKEELVAFTLNA